MELLIGTRSAGKTREIRELFAGLPFEISFPADRLLEPLPEEADLERSMSYAENAVAKARYYATRGGLPAIADDSGLEVDALGGAPGPRSARWSATGSDADNNRMMLEQLAHVAEPARGARYRCVVAFLATPSSVPEIVEATCDGFILKEPRGAGGFGYDPLFLVPELGQTFAELGVGTKGKLSHRARAMQAIKPRLLAYLRELQDL
jgi:XTP/dITP diphosphohydrolase